MTTILCDVCMKPAEPFSFWVGLRRPRLVFGVVGNGHARLGKLDMCERCWAKFAVWVRQGTDKSKLN